MKKKAGTSLMRCCALLLSVLLSVSLCTSAFAFAVHNENEHDYGYVPLTEPTCTEPGQGVYLCSCGATLPADPIPALGHAWDAGTVLLAPTTASEGIMVYTCTSCGNVKQEPIPALTPEFLPEEAKTQTVPEGNTKTSASQNIILSGVNPLPEKQEEKKETQQPQSVLTGGAVTLTGILPQEQTESVVVAFTGVPADALITVRPAATEANPDPAAIDREADGTWHLLPGEYTYTVTSALYQKIDREPFTVAPQENGRPLMLTPVLTALTETVTENLTKIEVLTVAVSFACTPENALISVYPLPTALNPEPGAIPPAAANTWQLLPGGYTYSAIAEGYEPAFDVPFTVEMPAEGGAVTVTAALRPVETETEVFDESIPVTGGSVAVAAGEGVFPAGAKLVVSEVHETRFETKLMSADPATLFTAGSEPAAGNAETTVASYSYDISLLDENGASLQPAAGRTATLTFRLPEASDPNLSARVLHEGTVIPSRKENGTVIAETTGFSNYTVEFYYGSKEYVIPGDSEVALSTVLTAVGLTGEVTHAAVSNEALFSVYNATGQWVLTAHQAFSSEEWLSVTINGVTYQITVKDDADSTCTVTVEFGAGHEAFASYFSTIDGFVKLDGTKLTYSVPAGTTISGAKEKFINEYNMLYGNESFSEVDNGELCLGTIALKPASDYTSFDQVNTENYENESIEVPENGKTYYVQWAKPVGPVSVTITPPGVGTSITVNKPQGIEWSVPPVEAEVSGNATLDKDSTRNWMYSNYSDCYTGTVKDGQNCFARFFVDAEYGYYFASHNNNNGSFTFADNTSVTVTNGSGVTVSPSTESVEIKAMVWAGTGEEPTVYNVKVDNGIKNGTVTALPITAHAGDTIDVTITPDEGYVLKSATWTPDGSEAVPFEITDYKGFSGSFEMPAADVTVSAVFDRVNMVYVDFGAGHEDFVQALYGNVEGYEVNGSVVSFQYVSTDQDFNNAFGAYSNFEKAPDYTVNPVDDGVCYMYDIALKTRGGYDSKNERDTETDSYQGMSITNGITFHALWAEPITASVTVTPPECGTIVKIGWKGNYTRADKPPVFEVVGHCKFDEDNLHFSDWDLNYYGLKRNDILTLKGAETGDQLYKAIGYLSTDWGYFLPEDMNAVTVTGGVLDSVKTIDIDTLQVNISVPVSHDVNDAVVVDPTCTENGSRSYTCPKCGQAVNETLEALGHDWGEGKVTTPATCEEKGVMTFTCANDKSHTRTEEIPALGHAWDEGKVTTAATCEEKGVRTFTCANDKSHTRTEEIPALGHNWGAWTETKAATCTAAGVEERVCGNDPTHKETREIPIDATAHNWGAWTVTKAATETEEGVETRTCANNAAHTETRSIPVIGHQHVLTKVEAKAATCEEAGNTAYWVCSGGDHPCGRFFSDAEGRTGIEKEDTVTKALGHAWDAGTVTTKATCEEKGVRTFTCANDKSHTRTEEIPALGHKWVHRTGTWSDDFGTCTFSFVCENDPAHTQDVKAASAATVTEDKVIYTAVAKLGDTSYTATAEVAREGYSYSQQTTRWVKGSGTAAPFRVVRSREDEKTYSLFAGTLVDNAEVAAENFTAGPGSVILSLKPAYLETLSVGRHSLTTVFADGYVVTSFEIVTSGSGGSGTGGSGTGGSGTGGSGTGGSGTGGSGTGGSGTGGSGTGGSGTGGSGTDGSGSGVPGYPGTNYNVYGAGTTYVPPSNNPRTGDGSRMASWIVLMGSSLAALAGMATGTRRRRKEH